MRSALGIIETIGLGTAITALDAACKAADVTLVGYDKVIGVQKAISVSVHVAGEVAAVSAAVEAGTAAANKVGRVVSAHVIPRPHEEVDILIEQFKKNLEKKKVNNVSEEEVSADSEIESTENVDAKNADETKAQAENSENQEKNSKKNEKKSGK